MRSVNNNTINVFNNENINRNCFHSAASYPSYFNKINDFLFSLGFTQCFIDSVFNNFSNVIFEEPTLLITPIIGNLKGIQDGFLVEKLVNKYNRKYNNASLFTRYNRVIPFIEGEIFQELKIDNVSFGVYYPQRNCVILYFNFFRTYKRIKFVEEVLNLLKEEMLRNNIHFQQLNAGVLNSRLQEISERRRIELEKQEEINKKQMLIDFKSELITQRNNLTRNMDNYNKSINEKSKEIVELYQKIIVVDVNLKGVNMLLDSYDSDFKKKIDEIKELSFVKDVILTSKGIEVFVGKVSLRFNNLKTYSGNYKIIIKPTHVVVNNIDTHPKDFPHPHVSGENPCLGTFSPKVASLLGQQRFKELIFLMYQFLNTYTEGRDGNPYFNFKSWLEFRVKENKYDEDGELKVKEVVINK